MSFFRKWKLNSKHKKLSEEWALATSLKNLSENEDNDNESISTSTTFNVKYLGCTTVKSERSENATTKAIKSVITTAKTIRRKHQRVILNVSPKGIEMSDPITGDSLLRVSIYKISFCSTDAAHDHVFAFIGSENTSTIQNVDEKLMCHAFLCPKRKIAHNVTLTVARCFESAYQNWRFSSERKMYQQELKGSCEKENSQKKPIEKSESIRDLLIDFAPDIRNDIFDKDHRNYLQNTWVSFDDEQKDMERLCSKSWEQQLVF